MQDVSPLEIALHLARAGLSVIPIRPDSKRPACSWKDYQQRRPGEESLRDWFGQSGQGAKEDLSMAVVCGEVSGGEVGALECIDFDDPEVFPEWAERVEDFAPALFERLVITSTPSGGRHVWYRAPEAGGNEKLAASDEGKVRIETRGEGGYALIPGSPGYAMEQGKFTALPALEPSERELLLHVAKSYNQETVSASAEPVPADAPSDERRQEDLDEMRPGDAFNAEGWPECQQLLKQAGWTLLHTRSDGTEEWRRPGKRERALSATYGHATGQDGGGRFYVFSTNAPGFEAEQTYTPFFVYAQLAHGGDYSAAGQALAEEGYGSMPDYGKDLSGRPPRAEVSAPEPAKGPPAGDGAAGAAPQAQVSGGEEWGSFPYADDEGRITHTQVYKSAPPKTDIVADFIACINREITTEAGDRMYEIEGRTRGGRPFTIEIESTAFEEARRLKSALGSAAGAKARVRTRMGHHLPSAVKAFSEDVEEVTRYERTGWAEREEGDRFLVPGREPRGCQVELAKFPFELQAGAYTEEDLSEAQAALRGLLTTHGPQINAPMIAHLLAGPLAWRAGLEDERCALLAAGMSGSLKTSWMQAAMCLWGSGFSRSKALVKWGDGATPNALMQMAAEAHDLPFYIDNYKRSTGRGAKAFISFIHNALEGGEKNRLNRASRLMASKDLRTWPVATGEDVPDTDPASIARMLILRPQHESGELNEPLAEAQKRTRVLPALGNAWIDFLESERGREVAEKSRELFVEQRTRWAKMLRSCRSDMVNPSRVASSLAINHITYQAALQCEPLAEAMAEYKDEHYAGLEALARTMADYGGESREAARLVSALQEAHASGRGLLLSEATGEEPSAYSADKIIGWDGGPRHGHSEPGVVYLLPRPARQIAEKLLEEEGGLSGISNRALYQQLDEIGALVKTGSSRATCNKRLGGKTRRVLWMKRDLFFDEEDVSDDTGAAF